MPDQNESKEAAQEKKPPEDRFFDPPPARSRVRGFIEMIRKHAWLIPAALFIGAAAMAMAANSFVKKVHTKQPVIQGEENREIMSSDELAKRIEASKKGELKLETREPGEIQRARKRNYKSDIAVYVEKKKRKSPVTALGERVFEKKEKAIGLPSGSKIPALLEDRVFSFNVESPVQAVVAGDVKWKEEVVIPKHSKFLGQASLVKSLDRINVSFHLLIFPDGREIRVRAMALSGDGSGGVGGKVKSHRDTKILKAIGESLVGGASLFLSGMKDGSYTPQDELRTNLAQNLTDEARSDLRSVRTEQSITVEAYTPIQVLLLESI